MSILLNNNRASDQFRQVIGSVDIQAGDFVSYDSNLELVKARAIPSHAKLVGFVVKVQSAGLYVVQTSGVVRVNATLVKGSTYFLSDNYGLITNIPPINEGSVVKSVGVAESENTLRLNINSLAIKI